MIPSNSNFEKSISKISENLTTTKIDFWNGNRSEIRQRYEREILDAILKATIETHGNYQIQESFTDYFGAEESGAFSEKKHHLLVTVAGNHKFKNDEIILISKPIAKNLLGYRIPIIRKKDAPIFDNLKDVSILKKGVHGIPETWSDATVFRHNDYKVSEEGNFDDIFERLHNENFDYVTFGANEVETVFRERASKFESLMISKNMMFFYPFPLVFYVNPAMPDLAKRIDEGLQIIKKSGELDLIFNRYYPTIVEKLGLEKRTLFVLENPLIPKEFANLKPNLALL